MSSVPLRSLPFIREDEVEIFRPGSPNLLGGLPEGIKREPTPFYKERPTILPTSPSKLSPSKKRKVGSPRPASKKSPLQTIGIPIELALKQLESRPQVQPQPQFKSLPALQPRRSNKENGLQLTVTRNAIGPVDHRRPLRRSKKENIPPVKRMDLAAYQEVLRTKERLDEEERAKAPAADDLDDDLMLDIDDDDDDDGSRPYDKREEYGIPDFYIPPPEIKEEEELTFEYESDSELSDFSDFLDFPVGEYGAYSFMFPELTEKIHLMEARSRVLRNERFQLLIKPHKRNFTVWDKPSGIQYWVGYLVIVDALSHGNRGQVPHFRALRIQFRSYVPANAPVRTPKESHKSAEFKVEFPECLMDPVSDKMIILAPWNSTEQGWVTCVMIPLPMSLFASRETRAFRLQAHLYLMESLQYQALESNTLQVTVTHLRKEKEMVARSADSA